MKCRSTRAGTVFVFVCLALTGILSPRALADWPSWAGPNGNFSSEASGVQLADGFHLARKAWTAEENVGAGRYPTSFKSAAVKKGVPPGGCTTPIVYDGKVFVSYFVPSGDTYAKSVEVKDKSFLIEADDAMLAVDATTGKTLWKTSTPRSGLNIPMVKRAGWGPTPVTFDGKVFKITTLAEVVAYDAQTGKELWRGDLGAWHDKLVQIKKDLLKDPKSYYTGSDDFCPGMVVAQGVVVCPDFSTGLVGFDPATGKKLWHLNDVKGGICTPTVFRYKGKEYVVTSHQKKNAMHFIDPIAGKVLWAKEGIVHTGPIFCNDSVGIMVEGAAGGYEGRWAAYRLTPEGAERAWTLSDKYGPVVTSKDKGPRPHVAVSGKDVYIVHYLGGGAKGTLLRINADSGEVLAEMNEGVSGNTTPWVIEDRIFLAIDLDHHGQSIMLDSKTLQPIGEKWNTGDTAASYEVTLILPYSKGFVYQRNEKGELVGWDLRANAAPPEGAGPGRQGQ